MSNKRDCTQPYKKKSYDKTIVSNNDKIIIHDDTANRVCLRVNYTVESSGTTPIDITLMTDNGNNPKEGE